MPELFYAFYEAGRFPVSIFRGWLRAFFTFVIPLAFVTTVPASALLGRLETGLIPIGFVLAIGLFILSNRLWNVAIRSYSSASS
jgi:ABC-2 type transport system permease protein